MIKIDINKVVDALVEMSEFMKTNYKTTWEKYTHEFITEQFTWGGKKLKRC